LCPRRYEARKNQEVSYILTGNHFHSNTQHIKERWILFSSLEYKVGIVARQNINGK